MAKPIVPSGDTRGYNQFLDPDLLQKIRIFVEDHWEETVRNQPSDQGSLIGLPFAYTVPSRKGAFQEIYYWDTYFTCLGLIESGRQDLALSNTRNLLAQVERFGFVPNGNRTYYLTRSQPPYLAALVSRVSATTGDKGLIHDALPLLRKEYDFWTTQRNTPAGLCRYGHHASEEELIEFHSEIATRAGLPADPRVALPLLGKAMAECESGWDFTPRFEHRCPDFCAVDLNCLLFLYEHFFADHGAHAERKSWIHRAEARKALVNTLCWDEARSGYFDYDFVHERRSPVISAASFTTLWTGVAGARQAQVMAARILPKIEYPFGIAACAPRDGPPSRQWDYPNGWPCLQYLVSAGLTRYGYHEDAVRIACKYIATVARSFDQTGELWEKYNVEDGSTRTFTEAGYAVSSYKGESPEAPPAADEAPAMMGWTAGVYMALLASISKK